MKILISADMEGTCGVTNWLHVTPPEYGGEGRQVSGEAYERARLRMTKEVNAAIEGALEAGAEEVIVNDSHNGMRNILIDELHPGAQLISGFEKPLSMVQGVDVDGVTGVFFTGYHARAGTPDGPLAHSFTGFVHDIRVNGTSLGEYGVNSLIAGHFNAPVAMISGDNRAVEQTRELLGDGVVGVPTKEGISVTVARNYHPEAVREAIRAGAAEAVGKLPDLQPYRLPEGATVEVDFDHQTRAGRAGGIPTVERTAWRTVAFNPSDGVELSLVLNAILSAAGGSLA